MAFSVLVVAAERVLVAVEREVRGGVTLPNDNGLPRYILRVSRCGVIEIEETISEMYARIIALLVLEGGNYCRDHLEHFPFVMGRIALTVEAALQVNIASHSAWLDLCRNCTQPLDVDLEAILPVPAVPTSEFSGGVGGNGGWFGAGGGGGGFGLLNGGAGGSGAAGAMLILQIAGDNSLLDVDAFLTPGSFLWTRRSDVDKVEVVAVGGGGGGGAGGRLT